MIFFQGWLVGEFAVNADDQNILLRCLGVHTIYINDNPVTGDVYHRDNFWFGINLDKGVHTMYIRLRTKVAANVQCQLKLAASKFEVLKPHFLPDLYDGYLFSGYVAVPSEFGCAFV